MVHRQWLVLALALGIPSVFIGDLTHFTWWGVVRACVHEHTCTAIYYRQHSKLNRFHGSICVLTGPVVWILFASSIQLRGTIHNYICCTGTHHHCRGYCNECNCDMLDQTAIDYGILYIPLNYLIHYFGVVVALLDPPSVPPVLVFDQIINALGM